jgi:transcriptional regulator with GAF, ATPase, and Fis domain
MFAHGDLDSFRVAARRAVERRGLRSCSTRCVRRQLAADLEAMEQRSFRMEERSRRCGAPLAGGFGRLVGNSPVMREIQALLAKIAASPGTTVLLFGERGTGKGVIAHEIHRHSSRTARSKPTCCARLWSGPVATVHAPPASSA